MFSVTADGIEVGTGSVVYDLSGDGWRVDDILLVSVEYGDAVTADRKSINKTYSTRERALVAAFDVANRKHQEAADAFVAATDQRAQAMLKLREHRAAAYDRINEAAALTD